MYNAPPPVVSAPPPPIPSARQERAARTGYGQREAQAPSVADPTPAEWDGAVRCIVSRDDSGWRRLCDVCSTSIFNVRLAEDDQVNDEALCRCEGGRVQRCEGAGTQVGEGEGMHRCVPLSVSTAT